MGQLNTVQNGKGSKSRITNVKRYTDNYDSIVWKAKGEYCCDCGRFFRDKDPRDYYADGYARCPKECNLN